MIGYVVLLFLLGACIPLSGWIAERRGRSIKLWCWMGFIVGPIAPLVVALLPSAQPSGPPPSRTQQQRTVGRTHGRASGERGDPQSLDMALTSTA
jgi:MFS family permease